MVIVSATSIERYIWALQRHMTSRWGLDAATRELSPLLYYINSGRASVSFLKKLLNAKPYMVARKLHMGGSDKEVMERVKSYIGFTPTF